MKRPTVFLPVLTFLAGFLLAWWIHRPVSVRETAAPAITLPSGGVVAPRIEPPAELPKVAKEAAKATGGKPARVGHVTVQPNSNPLEHAESVLKESGESFNCTCEPVRVDWSLIEAKDGFRMAFDTPSGVIIDSSDRPLIPIGSRPEPRWSVLGGYSPDGYLAGATRRLGRLPVEVGGVAVKFRGEWGAFAVAVVHLN